MLLDFLSRDGVASVLVRRRGLDGVGGGRVEVDGSLREKEDALQEAQKTKGTTLDDG